VKVERRRPVKQAFADFLTREKEVRPVVFTGKRG
jgi:hypothetical protein